MAHGIDVKLPQGAALMPGFNDQLTSAQIAALASYFRNDFGNVPQAQVTDEQVKAILSNKMPAPWLIRNAAVVAGVGIVAVLLLFLFVFWFVARRQRLRRTV